MGSGPATYTSPAPLLASSFSASVIYMRMALEELSEAKLQDAEVTEPRSPLSTKSFEQSFPGLIERRQVGDQFEFETRRFCQRL